MRTHEISAYCIMSSLRRSFLSRASCGLSRPGTRLKFLQSTVAVKTLILSRHPEGEMWINLFDSSKRDGEESTNKSRINERNKRNFAFCELI